MKKKLKNIIVCFLLMVPLILCGCDNPFGTSNSIGNNTQFPEIEQDDPKPGGNSGNNNSSVEDDTTNSTYYDPAYDEEDKYTSITDAFDGVKMIYKADSSQDPNNVKLTLDTATKTFLARLVAEYGLGKTNLDVVLDETHIEDANLDTYIEPFDPFTSKILRSVGLIDDVEEVNYTQDVLNKFVDYMLNINGIVKKTVSSKTYVILSTSSFNSLNPAPFSVVYNNGEEDETQEGYYLQASSGITSLSISSVFGEFSTTQETPTVYNNSPIDSQFSVITASDGTNTTKHLFIFDKTGFTNDFTNNIANLFDTHKDGVRKNYMGISGDDDNGYIVDFEPWAKTMIEPNKTYISNEEYVRDYVDAYGKSLLVDVSAIMLFGLKDDFSINIPDVNAPTDVYSIDGRPVKLVEFYNDAQKNNASTSTADKFIDFCCKYIDHNGFTSYETDMIAEFFINNYIGKTVLDKDETRYAMNTAVLKQGQTRSFNSNEAVEDGLTIVKYRPLLLNYNNLSARPNSRNDVFDRINYNNTVLNDVLGGDNFLTYMDGTAKYDSRLALFKNYINTTYASGYFMQAGFEVGIKVEYIDVDMDYAMNISFNEDIPYASTLAEEDEDFDEELGEDELEATIDTYLCGKLQSIVLIPKRAIEVHYIELFIEPNIHLLDIANDDSITVQPILRYCKDGKIYTSNILIDGSAKAQLKATIDEDSGVYLADPYSVVYGSGDFFTFTGEDNTTTSSLILSPKTFINNTATPFRKSNLLQAGKQVAEDSPYFKLSEFSNGKGVNYVYNDTSTDFIEISFIVTVNGQNYAGNYGLGVAIADIYGKII